MSPATHVLSHGGTFDTAWHVLAAPRRSLGRRHFAYAALAGLFCGALLTLGTTLITGSIDGSSMLVQVALQVLLAEVLLVTLAMAAAVPAGRLPMWMPFVLAGIGVSLLGSALSLLHFAYFGTQVLPPRLLAIEVARNTVIIAIPYTLAALGYWRGLDAWRRATALRDLQLERTRLSRQAYESRLQALQARVDPRFLFDTLASIEATYEADATRGERMIDDLIAYLRAALPALEDAASSLAAEIALVRAWLDLMRMRHGERLTFSIAVANAERAARVPPMVLQPLVQHAVEAIIEGALARPHVALAVARAGGRLRISITATGAAFSDSVETPATRAIRERLEVLYGDEASLTFRWASRDETRADLEIPHEYADRDHR